MDVYYAKENNIPYNENSKLPSVSGIGGDQLILGKTLPISLKYGNHICQAEFYIVDLPSYCAILGTDWLFTHNPTINFVTKELSFKSSNCISNCLLTPNSFTAHISSPTTVPSTKEKEPATVDRILKLLPTILQPYKDIFDEYLQTYYQHIGSMIVRLSSSLTLSFIMALSTRLLMLSLKLLKNILKKISQKALFVNPNLLLVLLYFSFLRRMVNYVWLLITENLTK
jgi:hypothetical protein